MMVCSPGGWAGEEARRPDVLKPHPRKSPAESAMSTNHTIINTSDGRPAFVVLPYDEYIALTGNKPRIPAGRRCPMT